MYVSMCIYIYIYIIYMLYFPIIMFLVRRRDVPVRRVGVPVDLRPQFTLYIYLYIYIYIIYVLI